MPEGLPDFRLALDNRNGPGYGRPIGYADDRLARLKQQQQRRRVQRRESILVGAIVTLTVIGGVLTLLLTFAFLGGIGVTIGWNLGLVHMVRATGGHIASISYWTGVGGSLLVGVLARIFTGSHQVQVKKA